MKRVLSSAVFALALAVASHSVLADSIINAWNCTLHDGKTRSEVQAATSSPVSDGRPALPAPRPGPSRFDVDSNQ